MRVGGSRQRQRPREAAGSCAPLLIQGIVWVRAGGFRSLCFNFIKYGLIFGALGKHRLITSMGRTHSRSRPPQQLGLRAWSPAFCPVLWAHFLAPWSRPLGRAPSVCKCCSVPLVKKELHHGNHLGDAGSDRVKPSALQSLLEG